VLLRDAGTPLDLLAATIDGPTADLAKYYDARRVECC
jgi:hypothetical protein